MSKQEFLAQLRMGLEGLPQEDIEERVGFFSEMIEDRMEEGFSEEEAVMAAGSVDEIVAQTVAEIPLAKIAKERIKPKRQLKAWEIVLLVLGSPIWFSLAVAAFAVVFAVYVSLWAVIVSLWAVFGALIGCSLCFILTSVLFTFSGNMFVGMGMLGAWLICTGITIFMFYGCKGATKGIVLATKKFALWIKNCFIK